LTLTVCPQTVLLKFIHKCFRFRQTDRHTDRQTDRHTERQTDTQKDRQTDAWTDRHLRCEGNTIASNDVVKYRLSTMHKITHFRKINKS